MTREKAKDAAARKTLEWIENGMLVGLGSGSTSRFFIKHLIEKCREGLQIQAISSSKESEELAKAGNIPLIPFEKAITLDLTVDGADEIDPQKRLIKGAGGALVREKILAEMSREMIVIADESKLTKRLGKSPLPIEVIPFCPHSISKKINELGLVGKWRLTKQQQPYLTDNFNWIYDVDLSTWQESFEALHMKLISIAGVVDTGFFFHLAGRIVIGKEDGSVEVKM